MRCQIFRAPLGALPVIAPFRGCASHQFTGGLDCFFGGDMAVTVMFSAERGDVGKA